ncbi:hypothetical protein AD998_13940 [bacterium 336/3]|nr:hypothetical protein AD998_13940 [bacterium 336/3]
MAFIVISLAYMSPVMKGQTLKQHDVVQHLGASHQGKQYLKETGEYPYWNPWMFAGMPNYMIMIDYPSSISVHLGRALVYTLPEPANLVFLYMLGAYIGLSLMGFNPWISALGAIAYAFTSYNIINIGAGHVSKCISVATIPMVIGAVVYTYRGKFIIGGILVMFFSAIHQYANFVQMTYYLGLTFLVFAGVQFFIAFKEKAMKQFWIASAICVVAGALSLSNHINRYLVINEYTKETIRGKNELSDSPENVAFPENKSKNKKAQKSDGLDKSYAFNWSYGIGETLNILIANGYGGSSFEGPKEDSNIMKALEKEGEAMGMPMEQLVNILESQGLIPSLYWGDQPGTGGPAYMGAVLLFLFVLGMFLSKNTLKWWLLGSVLLCLSIAWGKNFFLNDILFDYLPLFNKFRAVTMILSFMPIFLVIGAALGLEEIQKLYASEVNIENKQNLEKRIKWVAIGLGGFLLLLALLGGSIIDFTAPQDKAIQQAIKTQSPSLAKALIQGIQADRASMFTADAWRSVIFILLAIGGLFAYTRKYINFNILVSVLALLALIDLWGVDKRYLNNDKFVAKEEAINIEPTQANEQILKDKSYFRVLNLGNPYNDATSSYFHFSAGGYHAAKMRRYQDVITVYMDTEVDSLYKDMQSSGGNLEKGSQYKPLLDMLNIKYFIVPLKDNKNIGIVNPDAKGAVWFVENYKIVNNADEEFKSLRTILPSKTAFLQQQKGAEQLKDVRFDASAQIKLTSNSPDKMVYESNANGIQLAVFSEIYYKTATSGWKAYIDGKPVEHLKVNYLLRGLVVPSGKHTIEFKFEPDVYYKGERLALISSIVMLVLLLGGIFIVWRQSKQNK